VVLETTSSSGVENLNKIKEVLQLRYPTVVSIYNLMKKIIFLTGTRADFSKIKALISILDIHPDFEVFVLLRNAPARRVWIYTVRN
jgi:hypothetical protein